MSPFEPIPVRSARRPEAVSPRTDPIPADVDRLELDRAVICYQAGQFREVEQRLRPLIERSPANAEAWHLLAMARHEQGGSAEAIEWLQQAIALSPREARFYNNLGTVHEDRLELEAAIRCFLKALDLRPDYATAHNNLGELYKAFGDIRRSNECYRLALGIAPEFFACRSNLLVGLNHDPDATAELNFAEHERYGRLREPSVFPRPDLRDAVPTRPLRIGYVSPDIRKHAVARFLEPVLRHHDREQFQIYLYEEVTRPDATTQRLRRYAFQAASTVGQSAERVAERIRADGIDILVDLAGHTRKNRLDVFAERPAPIQATYLGYSNTTGLRSIDYRISDNVLDPQDQPSLATETVVRLPMSFACFEPPADAPDVRSVPSSSGRPLTFGSHHPLIRLNDQVLTLWLEVLERVPATRLLFMRNCFRGRTADVFLERLERLGFDLNRVELRCPSAEESSYLPIYHEIDILLDSFPATGHTMTCECLWMGVPVIAMTGDWPATRLSASVLHELGLNELVAADVAGYIAAAKRLANDPARLLELRSTLRERMRHALCDGPRFTRALEQKYRSWWENACRTAAASHASFGSTILVSPAGRQTAMPNRTVPNPFPPSSMTSSALTRQPAQTKTVADRVSELNEAGIRAAKDDALDEARKCFEQALALGPEHAGAMNNLGNVYRRLNQLAEAELQFLRASVLDPTDPSCQINLTALWRQQGRLAEALALATIVRTAHPRSIAAYRNLADTHVALGDHAQAIAVLQEAGNTAPPSADIWNELGSELTKIQRFAEAESAYRRAIEIDDDSSAAHANLANLLADAGDLAGARESYRRARTTQATPYLRLSEATLLAPIHASRTSMLANRQELCANLAGLEAEGFRFDPSCDVAPTLFYLAYQGLDDRPIHETMARLAVPAADADPIKQSVRGHKIRVGVLSNYLCAHTIGHLNRGWIAGLSRDVFEVIVISTARADDSVTRALRACADRYLVVPKVLPSALATLRELELDVLFYTDIGMDPFTYTLAFSRVAPVQCATWGHPVTSGLKTIDYFVSSEHLETPASLASYSERVEKLPVLGCYYEPPQLDAPGKRETFGLREDRPLLVCPQTLFKFHPDFDDVLGQILRGAPQAQLALIAGKYPRWTEQLKARWKTTLGDVLQRIVFLPSQPRQRYLQLLSVSDVMLDPLHFGGGNSSYEALALGLPIVTLPSEFLRGRLTYAMYRQMDFEDLIADSPDHYGELALTLVQDAELRRRASRSIRERGDRILADRRAIRALETFLQAAVDRR